MWQNEDFLALDRRVIQIITKICLFKYTENFTTKKKERKKKKKKNRHKENNVYPCKPQFYYIKVGFKGVKIVLVCYRDVELFLFLPENMLWVLIHALAGRF